MTGRRLLVTGAGGFSGEHVCRHFFSRGWRVTAAVRRIPASGSASWAWLGDVDDVIACDLSSRSETAGMVKLANPDCVVHLAGANAVGASWSDPAAVMQSNVMGTIHVLEGVRALGSACRVLVAGSMLRFPLASVSGDGAAPPHPYSLSKTMQVLVAQSWASLFAMDVLVAEPSNLIGPGGSGGLSGLLARYTAQAERAFALEGAGGAGVAGAKGEAGAPAVEGAAEFAPFRLSSRTESRDLLDVRDAAAAYETLLLAGERGRVYPVASGKMRTLGELADLYEELAACPLNWEVGTSTAMSPAPADNAATLALGWSPRYSLRRSIADALAHARAFT